MTFYSVEIHLLGLAGESTPTLCLVHSSFLFDFNGLVLLILGLFCTEVCFRRLWSSFPDLKMYSLLLLSLLILYFECSVIISLINCSL